MASEESKKRRLALSLYAEAFRGADRELPTDWVDQFLEMWNSPVANTFELSPTPPCGWAEFNHRLGGEPWHGAYDHTDLIEKDTSFPVGDPRRYGK